MNGLRKAPAARVTLVVVAAIVLGVCVGFVSVADQEFLFNVNRGIEVFGRVYREIAANYVDNLDPERFLQAGLDGMLGSLDPYTVYIEREDGDEVDLLTTGRYGGIGVTIGVRDGAVQVITVMDGYSAQRQGILPGDRFIEVNGVRVESRRPDEVRGLTRGEPGTEVKVLIEREGEKKPLEFVLVREEIKVKNVTFADFLEPGIAYVRLERFSRQAGEEVRQAIKELKVKGEVKCVILDLRGNPGGLLEAAVDVASKFIPRGSTVVSTKGRKPEADRSYTSTEDPLLPTVPMAVLTDRGSASASEIVAGSLQDLDRAVIVGTRTFGKGLVQTIIPLEYGAQLKITTARYYIPSGRSIQEVDYMHRDGKGVFLVTPDSLRKEFKTSHGRRVYEHGGVSPDSVVVEPDPGPMVRDLRRKSLFFKFVNRYVAGGNVDSAAGVTPAMVAAFKEFLEKESFDWQEESEVKVGEIRKIAETSHYGEEVLRDLDGLSKAIAKEKARGFERYKDHITEGLSQELMGRLNGEHGRIAASFPTDMQLAAAIGILKSPKRYAAIVGH